MKRACHNFDCNYTEEVHHTDICPKCMHNVGWCRVGKIPHILDEHTEVDFIQTSELTAFGDFIYKALDFKDHNGDNVGIHEEEIEWVL